MCSGLLAYRIWLVERSISTMRTQETSLMPILRVLVDSAVLYTAVLFPALICFLFSNTGEVVVVDMVISLVNNKKELSFDLLGHADHVDCLLYGARSHRNQ